MGLFTAIGAAIGAGVSAIASAVGSICSTIGGPIMKTISDLVVCLDVFSILRAAVTLISKVAELIIGKPEEETPEEIGVKAQVCYDEEGLKPEDFNSTEEYIDHLRNEIQVDEERMDELSSEERRVYAAVGAGLYTKDMEERYSMGLSADFWKHTLDAKLTVKSVASLIGAMSDIGVSNGDQFCAFQDGTLKPGSREQTQIYDALSTTLQKEFPEASAEEIGEKIFQMRNHED